jgi:hypothetical protein
MTEPASQQYYFLICFTEPYPEAHAEHLRRVISTMPGVAAAILHQQPTVDDQPYVQLRRELEVLKERVEDLEHPRRRIPK